MTQQDMIGQWIAAALHEYYVASKLAKRDELSGCE